MAYDDAFLLKVTKTTSAQMNAIIAKIKSFDAHASQQAAGAADPLKLDDLAIPDDNADLDVSATRHGLFPKLPDTGTSYYRDDGVWGTGVGGTVQGTTGTTANAIIVADGTGGATFKPASAGVISATGVLTGVKINDYIQLNPLGCTVPVTNAAGIDQDETTTNKNNYAYGLYTQSGDGVNRLQWRRTLTEDWKSDGNITIKIHWTVKTGTAGHKIKWELYCKQLADGESLDTALVSLGTIEDAIIGNEYLHITTAVTPALISGTAGSEVIFELRRIASAATETASDGRYLDGSIKYTRTLAA